MKHHPASRQSLAVLVLLFVLLAMASGAARYASAGPPIIDERAVPAMHAQPQEHLQALGSISGYVRAEDGVTPISGLNVAVTNRSDYTSRTCTSQANGSYQVANLTPGSYVVEALGNDDYCSEYYDGAADMFDATTVNVASGQGTGNINFALPRAGSISGRIFAADGVTPLVGVYVRAEDVDTRRGGVSTTNNEGIYQVTGLPTGNYIVMAQGNDAFVWEYYQDTRDRATATPVGVTGGENTPSIDLILDPAGSISGHVYAQDGATPVPNLYVSVALIGDFGSAWAPTDNSGYYQVNGLAPGTYTVSTNGNDEFAGEYYQDAHSAATATPVTVTLGQDTPGIDLVLDPLGSLSGHVYAANGTTALQGIEITACLPDSYDCSHATTTLNGSYQITHLEAGNYRVQATGDDDHFGEYYADTQDPAAATLVPVASGQDTPGIDFVLGSTGSISGYVYAANGTTPISGIEIHVRSIGSYDYHTATSAWNGKYQVTGLRPGRHTVRAEGNSTYAGEYYQDTRTADQATPVWVVSSEDTPGINLTLDAAGSIAGHVYAQNGTTPLAGVEVHVSGIDIGDLGYRDVTTSSDGSYRLTGLAPGTYHVYTFGSDDHCGAYYDEAMNSTDATPVAVSSGQQTSAIDLVLQAAGSISGHVYAQDGTTPIPYMDVYASRLGPYALSGHGYASTASDGSFRIRGLAAGDYRIEAIGNDRYYGEYYDDAQVAADATPVAVVGGQDSANITFVLDLAGTIYGRVLAEDGVTSLANVQVVAWGIGFSDYASASSALDGRYRITGLQPGEHVVYVYGNDNYGAEYYQNAGTSDEATPVMVVADQETSGIDFVLNPAGSISGHVHAEDGTTPIVGQQVSAYGLGVGDQGFVSTSSDGSYRIIGLTAGDYRVQVIGSDAYAGEYYQDTRDAQAATPVTARGGQDTPGIDFVLDPAGSISGHIYMMDGTTPLRDVFVTAYASDSGRGVGSSSSNSSGSYRISALAAGAYYVRTSRTRGYAQEYYRVSPEQTAPTAITVVAREDVPGIDLALNPEMRLWLTLTSK